MRRLTTLLSLGALLCGGAPLASQGTAADTALAARTKATATDSIRVANDSIRLERKRQQGVRVTFLDRFTARIARAAARVDSLLAEHRTPVVIVQQPPPDTTTPKPDTGVVVEQPPPDTLTSIAAAAALPRTLPTFAIPAPTRTVRVPAPGVIRSILSTVTFGLVDAADLQDAFNKAQPGDEIVLPSGATYTGNFVIPTKACGGWVTVRSDAPVPAAGVRVDTVTAQAFAKIVTPNSSPALKTTNPTCGWKLSGLEIAATAGAGVPGSSLNYGILWIGDGGWLGGNETVRSVATQPRDIVLEHLYVHGDTETNTTRCLFLNAGAAIVRDSWISDCHGTGTDAQSILLCNGTGPTLIENSVLQGSGENFMAGGCDPADSTLIPSDITFRRNYVSKPLGWKGKWLIKNLFELKNARRVLVEASVFENNWINGQMGMAWVIKSSTETCAACTWEGTKDVTMRWNIVRRSHRGLNIQAIDGSSAGTTASHTERVTVEHNLFSEIGASNGIAPSDGWLMLLTHDLKDIRIRHNTIVGNAPGYGLVLYLAYTGGGMRRVDISDNVLAGQSYYAIGSDNGLHTTALTNAAGTSWRFSGNVVSQINQEFWGAMPTGNTYVDRIASLGLRADFSLTSGTAGAAIAELLRRTAGVAP